MPPPTWLRESSHSPVSTLILLPTRSIAEKVLVTRKPRERAELQRQRADFCRVTDWLAARSALQIDEAIGHASRRVECRQQSPAEIFRELEERVVLVDQVSREQPAKQSDIDFEYLHGNVEVE